MSKKGHSVLLAVASLAITLAVLGEGSPTMVGAEITWLEVPKVQLVLPAVDIQISLKERSKRTELGYAALPILPRTDRGSKRCRRCGLPRSLNVTKWTPFFVKCVSPHCEHLPRGLQIHVCSLTRAMWKPRTPESESARETRSAAGCCCFRFYHPCPRYATIFFDAMQ